MTHPNRYTLERLYAADPDLRDREKHEAHVSACDACKAVFAELDAETAALMARRPPASLLANVAAVQDAPRRSSRRRWATVTSATVGLAAAAAFAFAILRPRPPEESDEWRWRGGTAVVRVVAARGDAQRFLHGEGPREGERVRFEVTPPPGRRMYAAVYGVEQGRVVALLPSNRPRAIEVSQATWLPGSVALDDASSGGQLVVIARPAAFPIETVRDELAAAVQRAPTAPEVPGMVLRTTVLEE